MGNYRKSVFVYNPSGGFLCEFDSIKETSKTLNISTSLISRAISENNLLYTKGYIFSNKKLPKKIIAELKKCPQIPRGTKKIIIQYDNGKNIVGRYRTIGQVEEETGIIGQNIRKVLNNGNNYFDGFFWEYLDN